MMPKSTKDFLKEMKKENSFRPGPLGLLQGAKVQQWQLSTTSESLFSLLAASLKLN